MKHKTSKLPSRSLAASLIVAGALSATQAQALLINFDLTSSTGTDAYGPGAAVFGTASSQWNHLSRGISASNLSLTDDTGAATSVKLNYTRSSSINAAPSGTFANLGISEIRVNGSATLSGLVADGTYELAIFSPVNAGFTVGGLTGTTTSSSNWSSLFQGTQYALFQPVTADGTGALSFTPATDNFWSAFQLQSETPPPPLPEPSSISLFGIGLAALYAKRRKARPRV